MRFNTGVISSGSFGNFSRMRRAFALHPEWWIWCGCLCVWALLFINAAPAAGGKAGAGHPIYCTPVTWQKAALASQSSSAMPDFLAQLPAAVSGGLLAWLLMVAAMMLPLLRDPLRHIAFSVRRKDRHWGLLWFLSGYLLVWIAASLLFLPLPILLNTIFTDPAPVSKGLVKASGFLLAAALIWLPGRPIRMIRCSWTMPIRISGWQLHADCLQYGLRMGLACLGICWAPMLALVLGGHQVLLMYAVTVVIIGERYFLPHISRLPGYAWLVFAALLFGLELWA